MKRIIVIVTLMAMSSLLHAALVARDLDGNLSNGHEGVYDDVLNITWLADANLAASNTFGVSDVNASGGMPWGIAESYVGAMNGGAGYFGVKTWRQATVSPVVGGSVFDTTLTFDGSTDSGYQLSAPISINNPNGQSLDFIGAELAYHYYNNLEGVGYCSGVGTSCDTVASSGVYGVDNAANTANLALFSNIQNSVYWTGAELASGRLSSAFAFHTIWGLQLAGSKYNHYNVWAVADGDVGASVVPVPAAAWLFGSALLGLVGLKRKK